MTTLAFRPVAAWRDMACGTLFCGFALVGLVSVANSPALMNSLGQGLDPGPALLPLVTLGLLLTGGTLILAKGAWRWVQHTRNHGPTIASTLPAVAERSPPAISQHLHAAALLGTLALLPNIVQWLGFFPAALSVATPWLVWLGYRRTRRFAQAVLLGCLISSLLCLSLYLIFITLLDVPL
ncbi:tripartite tricarboxylate transporter TctB family protein [Vreelandella olivaria]|uniref:tripartite tricarboxylate transporter TctB family protein n=1 Tax=Vreelandella olivaria TaxID=390919 RepID=UPI00201F9231|nr:tripartite tricarboxylate transporter TctB family protein [Halomonas olivaria]